MTTLGYGALTRQRELSEPTTSASTGAPGVRGYVDSLAALVPAEVLGLHALVVGLTTTASRQPDGTVLTTVVDPTALRLSFWGLVAVSCVFFVVGHRGGPWHKRGLVQVLIPPSAVVLWTMLQPGSAFDAVAPDWSQTSRLIGATFGAIVLGLVAGQLARTADAEPLPAETEPSPASPVHRELQTSGDVRAIPSTS